MNKLKKNSILKNIAIIVIIAIFFILDRYLKYLAINLNESVPLIKNFFSFTFVENKNIAFSIPLPETLILTLSTSVIIILFIFIIHLLSKKKTLDYESLPLTLIIFGAISNMVDRYLYGYVIDYLYLKNFTVFNLADALISIGTLTFIYFQIFTTKKEVKHERRR